MKSITREMIGKYGCKEKKIDFMGYSTPNENLFDFHHLIVPRRDCKKENIPHDGYVEWNGACLNHDTGHPYLHTIEHYDREMFDYITYKLIRENRLGKLDLQVLKEIDLILKSFEREYQGRVNSRGKVLVKEIYTRRDYKNRFR